MRETVTYREKLNRPPTLEDKKKARGLDGFIKKLQEVGWVDENGISLKCFNMEYAANNEKGNNYIEWNADLIK